MDVSIAPTRRVQRVRHELHRREIQVLAVEPLGPGFVTVTFGGGALAGFVSSSFDDHVKFIVNGPDGAAIARDYTPRQFDPAALTLTIEFALHGDGPAADWARQAEPGQRAAIAGPRGSMIIPTDYPWHLLAGDATVLPALRRRLVELPAGVRAIVVGQVPIDDRLLPPCAAALALHWVLDTDALLATLRDLPLPAGEGFVWCAGEASAMSRVRSLMLSDKAHPREALRVAAYWKNGAQAFHETSKPEPR